MVIKLNGGLGTGMGLSRAKSLHTVKEDFSFLDIIAKQIDLPPTLINRFDLIFPIKDLPDETKDNEIATHILHLHQNPN